MQKKGIVHFGLNFRYSPRGYYLTRENYITVNKKPSFKYVKEDYSDTWCKRQSERALQNFDKNMERYAGLCAKEFNTALACFLKKHREFKEVTDLKPYTNKNGYYILVLDHYKQVYIGTSSNITRRIRTHFTKIKEFDRLIFGNVENSTLSVDSFLHYDTTRIFVYVTNKVFISEEKYIKSMPETFLLNRVGGGEVGDGIRPFVAYEQSIKKDIKKN